MGEPQGSPLLHLPLDPGTARKYDSAGLIVRQPMNISRRRFLTSTAVAGAALAAHASGAEGTPPRATSEMTPKPTGFNPSNPALKYDLVIAGGDVLDPGQKLHGKRDIGIKNGRIAAVDLEHLLLPRQ